MAVTDIAFSPVTIFAMTKGGPIEAINMLKEKSHI